MFNYTKDLSEEAEIVRKYKEQMMFSDEENKKEIFPKSPPVQETEFPNESATTSLSSLSAKKDRLFGYTHDPDAPNIDAHADRPTNDMTENTEGQTERPPSSGSEPVENEDTSAEPNTHCAAPLATTNTEKEQVPASTSKSNDPECETHIHDQDSHEHDEEVIYRREMARLISEGGTGSLCSSSASLDGMRRVLTNSRGSSGFDVVCDECDVLRRSCISSTSLALWDEVEKGCISNEYLQRCHKRFWPKFKEVLDRKCKSMSLNLKDKNLTELLKRLFKVDKKGQVEEIELTNVVYAIRFFGPLVNIDGESPFIQHVHEIVTKSAMKTTTGKISWFAGLMSRDDADDKLQDQKNCTYLIRMSESESESGSFVISVKKDYVHHFMVEGDPEAASQSQPFSCHLRFDGKVFRYITDVAYYLRENPIIDPECEDGNDRIWCTFICPGLPLNSAIVRYKTVRR